MDLNRPVAQPPKHNLPPYRAVTEKILGIRQTPCPKLLQRNENFERLPHTPLHSPPFWWGISPKSSAPWQCWSLDDFTYTNCKWEGCYKQCSCQQKEEKSTVVNCRFPNHCGFHRKQSIPKDSTNFNLNTLSLRDQYNEKKNMCCYCRLNNNGSNIQNIKNPMPDPRCLGQYHQSLLENIIGRGTTLEISKAKREDVEKECLVRGYIPGDVHGWKGWSGHIGGDPMYEEYNNAIYPVEDSTSNVNLTRVAENWDGLRTKKDEISRQPPYKCHYHDHRLQYGISPDQLNYPPS